jgi:hypothetical protein
MIEEEKIPQIRGSVVRPTEIMSEQDSVNAFIDGAKMAASAARELAKETGAPEWHDNAAFLEQMGVNGKKLSQMKAMTRLENAMAAQLKSGSKFIM